MNIFIVNGKGGSGKDAFESFVIEYAANLPYAAAPVLKLSIIDYVKDIAKYAGWDGGKTQADRKFLCDLKSILTKWNDSPMLELYCSIEDIENHEGKLSTIFIDMREPIDIARFKQICKENSWNWEPKTVLIKRDTVDDIAYGNKADDGVFDYNYDIVIENYGTLSDLKDSAKTFYNNYIGGVK